MDAIDFYSRKYPYIYRGVIEDNVDPKNIGRCKVRVPFIHGELNFPPSALPWARPIVLTPVNRNRGSVNLPDIGDIVWVFFEGADKEYPLYLGGTYATGEVDIDHDNIDLYIEKESKLSYSRGNKIWKIQVGNIMIEITPDTIHLNGDTVIDGNLEVSGNLSVSGTTTLSNLVILGSCNKECDCE